MKEVVVVYSTDLNYLAYTVVSMLSLLRHLPQDEKCSFFVLMPEKDCEYTQNKINKVLKAYSNYSLTIIGIGDQFASAKLNIAHITLPTYYRLLLPTLLEDKEKCLYIDGDTIICDSIVDLYKTDMGDNLVAGVKALDYYKNRLNVSQLLDIDSNTFEYVNAGVLLMNLKKMREENISSLMMSLISNNYQSQDQDIINKVCQKRILILPMKYNVMSKYFRKKYKKMGSFSHDEFKEANLNPVIIHYADKTKPWNDLSVEKSEKWLEICLLEACWPLFSFRMANQILEIVKNSKAKEKSHMGIRSYINYFKQHDLKYIINRLKSNY